MALAEIVGHLSLFCILNLVATVILQGYQIRMLFEFAMAYPGWAILGYGIYLIFYFNIFKEEKRAQVEALRILANAPGQGLLKG